MCTLSKPNIQMAPGAVNSGSAWEINHERTSLTNETLATGYFGRVAGQAWWEKEPCASDDDLAAFA